MKERSDFFWFVFFTSLFFVMAFSLFWWRDCEKASYHNEFVSVLSSHSPDEWLKSSLVRHIDKLPDGRYLVLLENMATPYIVKKSVGGWSVADCYGRWLFDVAIKKKPL